MPYETLSRKKKFRQKIVPGRVYCNPVGVCGHNPVCGLPGCRTDCRGRSPAFPVVELDHGIIVVLLAAGRGFCSGLTRLASDMLQEEAPRQLDMQVRSERRVLALGGDCKVDTDSRLEGQSSRQKSRIHQHLVLKRGEASRWRLQRQEKNQELERRWGLELLERGRSPGCGCCREGSEAGEGMLVSMRWRSDEIEATRTATRAILGTGGGGSRWKWVEE